MAAKGQLFALPAEYEETPRTLEHFGPEVKPVLEGEQWKLRLVAGALMGKASP